MNVKAFVVDIARCNGCHNCQVACKDEFCDNDWSPYAKPQPEVGQFWLRVQEKVRGSVPLVRISYSPVMCQHCQDAPCERACAEGAFERRDDGLLFILPERCTGCMACVDACPLGMIFSNDELAIAQKCTGCAHLLDAGWTVPRCVDACPTDALRFCDVEELADVLESASCLPEVHEHGSRVYYLNLPKRFVGGTLFDSAKDEVVVGATVQATDISGTMVGSTVTDEFGDYMFDQVAAGQYELSVLAKGYESRSVLVDLSEKDMCLGDLDLCS